MQCQSCDAKDQVTIAGKTFCANCGTPANESSGATIPQSSATTMPLVDTPMPTAPSAVAATHDDVASANTTNVAPAVAENSDTLASELTSSLRRQAPNEPSSSTPVGPTNVSQKPTTPTPPATPIPRTVQAPIATPTAPVNNAQPQGQSPATLPTPVPQPANTTASVANSNSEFTSLDNKDEGIFTDDQLNALANSPGYTAPTSPSTITKTIPAPQAPVTPQSSPANNLPTQDRVTNLATAAPAASSALASSQPAHIRPMNDIKTSPKAPSPVTSGPLSSGLSTNPPTPGPYRSSTPNNTSPHMQSGVNPVPAHQAPLGKPAPSTQHILSSHTQPAQPKPPTTGATPQHNNAQGASTQVMSNNVSKTKNSSKGSTKKLGSKVASVSLSLAGLILLGVYVWQINYPNLALKVASSKAGISASLPSYVPSGWQVSGDIQSNPGSIGYELKSSDGAKTIAVNEDRSEWDSQALAENYLATKTNKYTTVQSEGLTIYLYNNNQASWINHGTWYRIEGDNHGLSQDQIIKMATSL